MRSKFFIMFIALIIFQGSAIAVATQKKLQTAIFKAPNIDPSNWKEISRFLDEQEGVREFIPTDQSVENWTDLICIQYLDLSGNKELLKGGIELIVDLLREETSSAYPCTQISWNVVQKNRNDVIFEWVLHEPYKKVPAQHEISRGFLSKGAFHRVGITHKNSRMTSVDRNKWIELLKKYSSVKSLKEASNSSGFSFAP